MPNSSNNSTFLSEIKSSSIHWTTFVISLTMLVFCIVGAYGNLISVIIFSHRTMKAPINILLKALSLIDTALILSSVVVFIVPNLNLTLKNAQLLSACEFASLYLYPLSMTAQTCSVWTFVLVSLERYLAVCVPLQRHKLMTVCQAKAAQVILLITALCYNFVRFWEYERTDYEHAGFAPIQPLLRFQKWYFLFYYVILYIVTHFLIPFGAILVLNAFIVRALRSPASTSITNRKLAGCRLRKFSRRQFRQRQTTHMIIMITLIFAVCNAPAFLINIWEGIDENLFYGGPWTAVAYVALDISNNLVVFNSSSTFIIYMLYCNKYRTLFIRYGLGNCGGTSRRPRAAEAERTTEYISVATTEEAEVSIV